MFGKLVFIGLLALGFFVYLQQASHSKAQPALVAQSCAGAAGAVTAAFAWPEAPASVNQVWLDLGLTKDFRLGWYESHGPLPPSQSTYAADGLAPGATYYYRVQSETSKGRKTIASGSLIARCAGSASSGVDVAAAPPAPPPAAPAPAASSDAPIASTIISTLAEQPALRDAIVESLGNAVRDRIDTPDAP